MKYKKTAETLIAGSHTLKRKYYVEDEILNEEYNKIFLKNFDDQNEINQKCLLYTMFFGNGFYFALFLYSVMFPRFTISSSNIGFLITFIKSSNSG